MANVELKVGEMAPAFEGKDQHGNAVSLQSLSGRRVILYFYPKDNTPGCTAEACSLRDGKTELLRRGFTIVGVSPDSERSHAGFDQKHSLGFTLISDPDHRIATDYGVWGLKKFMGREYMGVMRKTFIINTDGTIEKIFDKVDTKRHFDQILESYTK